jgi:hypothetical protein
MFLAFHIQSYITYSADTCSLNKLPPKINYYRRDSGNAPGWYSGSISFEPRSLTSYPSFRFIVSLNLRHQLQDTWIPLFRNCLTRVSRTVYVIVVCIAYVQFEKWHGRSSGPETVIRFMSIGDFISYQDLNLGGGGCSFLAMWNKKLFT